MNKSQIGVWLQKQVVKYPCTFQPERHDHELYGEITNNIGSRGFDIDQLYKLLDAKASSI
jgi:hypothetical protein